MKSYLLHLQNANRIEQEKEKEKLLRFLLDDDSRLHLEYGSHGKPYLKENPWYFNISHSGEYLLFVQGEYEIGADLQIMRPCKMDSIAKKGFTEEERQWVWAASTEEERTKRFYLIWCRKEAYGKYLGCGLTEEIFAKNTLDLLDTITFLEYDILERYHVCICCKKEEEIEETVHLLEGL